MKLRLACTSLVVLCGLVSTTLAAERVSGRPPKAGEFNPADESVEMFAAMKAGQIEVKMVHKDVSEGKVFIKNKSDKPLNVKLPDAFVGVHVLPQMMGGGTGGIGGGMGQMSGGGMGGGGGGGGGGNFFNVAPEKVGEVPFVSVCLEHGKPDPRPAMTYEIRATESASLKPEVVETLKLLKQGAIPQRVAQVLAWHQQCGMSFEELAAKQIKPLVGQPYPYFDMQEIQAAMQTKAHIAKQLEAREQGAGVALPNL